MPEATPAAAPAAPAAAPASPAVAPVAAAASAASKDDIATVLSLVEQAVSDKGLIKRLRALVPVPAAAPAK